VSDEPTARDLALRYAERGWRVYPVAPGRKKALFTGWQRSATIDPDLIARQWRRDPYPGVGLICGETFAVFDIEAAHLRAFFDYLDRGAHAVPETAVCLSGRGGLHLYVAPIPNVITTRQLRLDGVHIGEFKTTGGVLAPPSVTVGPYRWLWWPEDPEPPEAPIWLSTLISGHLEGANRGSRRWVDPAAALDALACAVRDEPEGNRNSILYWAACRAREEGIRDDISAAVLRRVALASGLEPAEVAATIASAQGRRRVAA
jgi:hypothetical protein